MSTVYSEDTPFLKLGPGPRLPESEVVRFVNGYAEIDPADPHYEEKMRWVRATPGVEVLDDSDAGRVPVNEDVPGQFLCTDPSHEPRAFASQKALAGHRMGAHAPKRA